MKLILVLVVCAVSIQIVYSANVTDDKAQNKTKRGLVDQTHNYGEQSGFKPVNVYHDQVTAAASPGLGHYYTNTPKPILFPNPVFESEAPKQVTAQQVLYEYQQTPHNAVSNVHVNQQFQTLPDYRPETADLKPPSPETAHTQRVYSSQQPPANPPPNQQFVNQQHNLRPEPNQFNVNPESVVLPVHHSTFVHHGQPYATHLYPIPQNQQVTPTNAPPGQQPLPHQAQPQQPYGKYIYLNGKIVYHPLHPQPALYQQQQAPYPGLQAKHPALSYTNQYQHPSQQNRPQPKPQQLFQAAPVKFVNHQIQWRPIKTTTLPPPPPPKIKEKEEEEEEREKADTKEEEVEEEEENEEPARYETEEEEEEEEEPERKPYRPFSKYFEEEEEEEDDHKGYQKEEEEEEESEDDNKRGSSKKIVRKPYSKKYYKSDSKPYRFSTNDNYKYREGYRSKSKYGKPYDYYDRDNLTTSKKPRTHKNKDGKEPTTQYKAFKYVKASKAKPKLDNLEGRQSQNVPVIHSQKLYKEKWYVSKSKDI